MSRPWAVALASLTLIALASGANAVMDTLSFRFEQSVFAALPNRQWWDPQQSWPNKWKNGDRHQGEAFPLSSTALVATTDAWHLAKAIAILSLIAAVILPFTLIWKLPWFGWVAVAIGIKLLYGLVFEGLFAHALIR